MIAGIGPTEPRISPPLDPNESRNEKLCDEAIRRVDWICHLAGLMPAHGVGRTDPNGRYVACGADTVDLGDGEGPSLEIPLTLRLPIDAGGREMAAELRRWAEAAELGGARWEKLATAAGIRRAGN